ncbi:MAG: redoxin family protein [Alphaproteobacteria bacterium]|nr:redoxin family protein [Alphaproteobacteria bacterium]
MTNNMIAIGDRIPGGTVIIATSNGPEKTDSAAIFGKGKVAFFAVPGAFTPTCSAKHLPGFIEHASELASKGVNKIICLSVNDAFVMQAWGEAQGVGDKIVMLADGNGEFTKALGLTMDASGFGMGTRSQRFSGIAEDGVLKQLFVEQPGAFEVSSAEYMIARL